MLTRLLLLLVPALCRGAAASDALSLVQQSLRDHPPAEDEGPVEGEDEDMEDDPFRKKRRLPQAVKVDKTTWQEKLRRSLPEGSEKTARKFNRCSATEISSLHEIIATDLSGAFGKDGKFGLQWPDMTDGGRFPQCTEDNIVGDDVHADVLVECMARRSRLSWPCASCWVDASEVLAPSVISNVFGINKTHTGCTSTCTPPLIACKKSMKDMTYAGECLGAELAGCVKCLTGAADRLTNCIGDTTVFTPSTLMMMVTRGFKEKNVLQSLYEYITGLGAQNQVEKQRLASAEA